MNFLLTNDVKTLKSGEVIYSFMCYPNGGVVDDLLAYKFSEDYYYLVVNASNKEKDFKWMLDNKANFEVTIENFKMLLNWHFKGLKLKGITKINTITYQR